MFINRLVIAAAITLGVSACSLEDIGSVGQPPIEVERSYVLSDFTFGASDGITVSEEEGYYPVADIVWRGDPRGPRVEQIGAMFQTAFDRSQKNVRGAVPVVVDFELRRFHGVTNRSRYSVGGVYNIVFNLTVRDARSGEVIEPSRRVVANLDAPGGNEAVVLEESGQTEKVRVTDFLTTVLMDELS